MSDLAQVTANVERLLADVDRLEAPIHAGRAQLRSAMAVAGRADRDPDAQREARIRTEYLVSADRALAEALAAAAVSRQAGRTWLALHAAAGGGPAGGGGSVGGGATAGPGGGALGELLAVTGALGVASGQVLAAGTPGDTARSNPQWQHWAVATAAGGLAALTAGPLVAAAFPLLSGPGAVAAQFFVAKGIEVLAAQAWVRAGLPDDDVPGLWSLLNAAPGTPAADWSGEQWLAWATAQGGALIATALNAGPLVDLAVSLATWRYQYHATHHGSHP